MLKSAACVIRRVDIHAFHLTGELLLQSLERQQVVAVYEHIVGGRVAVVAGGVVQQDARLHRRLLPFANPCQFQFLHCVFLRSLKLSQKRRS